MLDLARSFGAAAKALTAPVTAALASSLPRGAAAKAATFAGALQKATAPAVAPAAGKALPPAVPKSSGTATTAQAKAATDPAAATQEAADRFLTLLVTQLRNQDPLNPMDNAQVTTQLAQLSTVTGINRMNESLAALLSAQAADRTLQAAALVGHDVTVDGNAIAFDGEDASGGFDLVSAANAVTVTIADASGKPVRTLTLPAQPAGEGAFTWDGKTDSGALAAPGRYTFTVTATGAEGAVAATTSTLARVTGVVAGADGPRLVLGSLGEIAIDAVRAFH
ncbi:MAG: flagellar hook assembly protein FlgD [Burkholderiales bacterium]|nr:flagellar hook assembly protein FlgD [Burkholderiales bacterium]